MSKNITIQEGGIGKQLTVDKLKTNLVGGGSCLWVPEDETTLGTKYISENGTYKASDDGYYGYSEVTVSGQGSVTGKDPDGSGDEATATVDPETGEIAISKIPSSIKIITPPTNPSGSYQNGQAISKDGMVIKAYLESGSEYGIVPNGEVTLNPSTAIYDSSTDVPGGGEKSSGLETGFVQPIPYSAGFTSENGSGDKFEITGGRIIAFGDNAPCSYIVASSGSPVSFSLIRTFASDPDHPQRSDYSYEGTKATRDGKDVYYVEVSAGFLPGGRATRNSEPYSPGAAAWTIIYGEGEEHSAGSRQNITASWPRPGDSKILSDSFEIYVQPSL